MSERKEIGDRNVGRYEQDETDSGCKEKVRRERRDNKIDRRVERKRERVRARV